jgi:hypothetical protein
LRFRWSERVRGFSFLRACLILACRGGARQRGSGDSDRKAPQKPIKMYVEKGEPHE